MDTFQLFVGFLIFWAGVIRPLLLKPCARLFPAEYTAAFVSVWAMVCVVASWPVFGHLMTDKMSLVLEHPLIVIVSALKGVVFWYNMRSMQIVNKESTSSAVFNSFIGLGIMALVNGMLGEKLLFVHLLCVLGLTALGVVFMVFGHAQSMSNNAKKHFLLLVLMFSYFGISDQIVIPVFGWFFHLTVCFVTMFLMAIICKSVRKKDLVNMFTHKAVILAGVVWAVSEFIIIYSSIIILPVTIISVFGRLSIPIVMLISAVHFKEKTWKNQLLFGALAFALALPIFLVKG